MIRRFLFLLLALSVSGAVLAGRTPGFSMAAFRVAVPSSAGNAVFSPLAFELDCVLVSEAFGPIEKAVYVEALGALVGYDSVYKPVLQQYASESNRFSYVSAKAFLVPSLRMVTPKFRSFIQSEYGAHACPVRPTAEGAESYLKVAMDGEMEDFRIPSGTVSARGASFCDLESFRCGWDIPFSASNTVARTFAAVGGSVEVMMMSDVREASIWDAGRFSLLRLPMADGMFFFAALPGEGVPLDSIRGDFAADKFDDAVSVFRAVADPKVFHGAVDVMIPKFTIDTVVDLKPAFTAAALPLGGFKEIALGAEVPLGTVTQRTRFVLDERAAGAGAARPVDAAPHPGVRRFVCDRPFLFFVCHDPTMTVPVAGVYVGR